MKWAIDGSALGSGRGGDETYLRAVLDGLRATAPAQEEVVVVHRATARAAGAEVAHGGGNVERIDAPARSGAAFYGHAFGRAFRGRGFDAAFSMTHAPLRAKTPVALVVMDLSYEHLPDAYPRATRARLRAIIGRQARSAACVVTISEYSRRDIAETYAIDPTRIFVVPGAVAAPLPLTQAEHDRVSAWRRELNIDDRYLLYLGNLHPRKNVARAIRAFAAADLDGQFVIAGSRWWGADEKAALAGVRPGRVVLTGRVDDQQREVLLRDAHALVYPSLFEGFGLPPLEAMRRGVPVIASQATAIPETLADAAVLVDPLDCAAMAAAFEQVFHDAPTRERLVRAGYARAQHFSVERAGAATRFALLAASRCKPAATRSGRRRGAWIEAP